MFALAVCERVLYYARHMMCHLWLLALVLSASVRGLAQECPQSSTTGASSPSAKRALEGQLIYHDGIRKWFELKLDKPECGQKSIQLVQFENSSHSLEVLRGCRVRSTGSIDFSPTGYYSLNTSQAVDRIEPVGACTQQPAFPDYSSAKPDSAISTYRVDMHVDYSPGDHPIVFRVSSTGKELQPWQAYASYDLTGGFVLYGHCGKGFVVDKVFGTPEANPSHFDEPHTTADMAEFDPEGSAAKGKRDLRLGYTCVREKSSPAH